MDALTGRVDALTGQVERVEHRMQGVEQHLVGVEMRVATELIAVADAVRSVHHLIATGPERSALFEDHERRIAALERKTG